MLINGDANESIRILETYLGTLSTSRFSGLVGSGFQTDVEAAIRLTDEFYESSSQVDVVSSLIFCLNEFDINPNKWWYRLYTSPEVRNPNDCVDVINDGGFVLNRRYVDGILNGMQEARNAFKKSMSTQTVQGDSMSLIDVAHVVAYSLVIARFCELVQHVQQCVVYQKSSFKHVRCIATSHGCEYFFVSKVNLTRQP